MRIVVDGVQMRGVSEECGGIYVERELRKRKDGLGAG